MTEAQAFDYVALYVEARRDPVLLDSEISTVLSSHSTSSGSWDLDWTILDLWKIKLGRCSDYYDVTVGGRTHSAEAVSRHCSDMVKLWEKRISVSLELCADEAGGDVLVVANYNNPLTP